MEAFDAYIYSQGIPLNSIQSENKSSHPISFHKIGELIIPFHLIP